MLPTNAPNREIIAWATQRAGGGRGFGFTGGHYHTNWGVPEFRQLVVNAILWTARLDVPRSGAKCAITPEDLKQNLDDKPTRKQ
jgi:type 1 glutamine amidotransferase